MSNEYYDHTTYPATSSTLASSPMRSELDAIEAGFDKMPTLAGNGGKITAVNAGGTAVEAITTTGTGSGVRATSPTLVTPELGAANATSINRVNIAGVATAATLGLADNSSLSTIGAFATNFTFTGHTNVTIPTSGTLLTSATPVAALAGGTAGQIVYQSATDTTSFVSVGGAGKALISNGSGSPTWTNGSLALAGNLTTAGTFTTTGNFSTVGNFSSTITLTGNTTVTLPTNGTLALAGANTDITSLGSITIPTPANGTANGTAANTLFVLNATTPLSVAMQSVDYSMSGNALTLKLNPTTLAFRSTTLTTGTPTFISNAAQITTTISSTSTAGTVSAVQSEIVILAINNAGTMELAWVNIAGGVNLDETTLINTTAEGGAGAADSATVIYSTTARTGVAFRVVGIFRSTQTTAGLWAQAPSLVQPIGGQALMAMSSMGYGQTWQNLSGSRALGTTYYNTTGKPITVEVTAYSDGTNYLDAVVGGVTLVGSQPAFANYRATRILVVPPRMSYSFSMTGTTTLVAWNELR